MTMRKQRAALVLAVAFCLLLLPASAWAASDPIGYTFDVSEGDILVNDAGGGSLTVTYGPVPTTTAAFPYTQMITLTGSTTEHTVTVGGGVTAGITLSGVTIDVSAASGACAFDMTGATVNLTLAGNNILKSGYTRAGLQVPGGASVTIDVDGPGALTAIGNGGAGIGGFQGGSGGGHITIKAGAVTAIGDNAAAGIGSGYKSGDGGTVIISGGMVTATGSSCGAGIGGGCRGNGGTVIISGGTVTATGGNGGAGIGGGANNAGHSGGRGGAVYICGGSVLAKRGGAGTEEDVGRGRDYAGPDSATLKNKPDGANIYRTTLTLAPDTGIPEADIGFGGAAAGYGRKDLVTDGGGVLYFYLPEGGAEAAYGGGYYTETVEANHGNAFELNAGESAYAVGYALTNLTPGASPGMVMGGRDYTGTLAPEPGFARPASITVAMGGVPLEAGVGYSYNRASGAVQINNITGNVLITAAGVAPSGGSSDSAYAFRSLRDSVTGVRISGSIHSGAGLTVSQLSLHPDDPACSAIRTAQASGDLILGLNIELSGDYAAPLTISIPVGSGYNGRTMTILHCINGSLEVIAVTAKDGMATFEVSSLSPFGVARGLFVPGAGAAKPPKTGGAAESTVFVIFGSAAICAIYLAMKRRKA